MKKTIVYLSCIICFILVFHALAEAENFQKEKNTYTSFQKDICNSILEMYSDRTLTDVFVGSITDNYQRSFFADLDNDGKSEEFQFFTTRTYAALGEIVDGERRGLPGASVVTEFYNGEQIVHIGNEFFILYMTHEGPLELARLREMSEEEFNIIITDPRVKPPIYNKTVVCKYYTD